MKRSDSVLATEMARRQIRNLHAVMGKKLPARLRRPPRWLHPVGIERSYSMYLVQFIKKLSADYVAALKPRASEILDRRASARKDDDSDDFEEVRRQARKFIDSNQEDDAEKQGVVSKRIAAEVSEFNRKQWANILQASFNIDLVFPEPWLQDRLKSFLHHNVAEVSGIKSGFLRDVEALAFTAFRNGWRWESLASKIEDRTGTWESRAEYVGRNQVANLNSELTQARQEEAGVTGYIWRTSRDERVRGNPGGKYPDAIPSHYDREGESYDWANPPNEGNMDGHPGMPPNCRCTAEPDLGPLYNSLKGKR